MHLTHHPDALGSRPIKHRNSRRFRQGALIADEAILDWTRRQVAGAGRIFSVRAGALLCGAARPLNSRTATPWGVLSPAVVVRGRARQ